MKQEGEGFPQFVVFGILKPAIERRAGRQHLFRRSAPLEGHPSGDGVPLRAQPNLRVLLVEQKVAELRLVFLATARAPGPIKLVERPQRQ